MPEGERETMGEITDNSLRIAKMAVQKFAQDPDIKSGQSQQPDRNRSKCSEGQHT